MDTPSTSGIESSEFQWNHNSSSSYSYDSYSSLDLESPMINPNIAITVTPTYLTEPSFSLNNNNSQPCQEGEEFQELIQQLLQNENFKSIISQNGLDKDEDYDQLTENIGQIDLSDNGEFDFYFNCNIVFHSNLKSKDNLFILSYQQFYDYPLTWYESTLVIYYIKIRQWLKY